MIRSNRIIIDEFSVRLSQSGDEATLGTGNRHRSIGIRFAAWAWFRPAQRFTCAVIHRLSTRLARMNSLQFPPLQELAGLATAGSPLCAPPPQMGKLLPIGRWLTGLKAILIA